MLTAVSDARRKRAAHALAQAKRELRYADAQQAQAETEAATLQASAIEFEREWHCAQRQRKVSGIELHRARAAQTQRQALADKQADRVRTCEQDSARARRLFEQARQRHGTLARKDEKLRVFGQRLDNRGDA